MDKKNPTQIDGSKLTTDQICAGKNFLAAIGWPENEDKRTVTRDDMAKVVAWYGGIRFLAGVHGIGTLEHPNNPIVSEKKPADSIGFEFTFDELTMEDVQIYNTVK
jgi:hypothetical protein